MRPTLTKLARRLALGHFLEIWPAWAAGSLLVAGLIALICRLFLENAAPFLKWLWPAPLVAAIPAIVLCKVRAYRPHEIVALADSLTGGRGTLLTLYEIDDPAWAHTQTVPLPKLRPWRKLWPVFPALAFLAMALLIPQRFATGPENRVLANEIADELKATVAELKKQDLITPEEEKKLGEEIERIRAAAQERMDSSSWEAADALREKVIAGLSEKKDALKWAEESLARFAAAAQAGATASSDQAAELAKAIERLSQMGMLSNAPPELQKLLGGEQAVAGGKNQLPADPASLRRLSELLSEELSKRNEGFGEAAGLGKEFGRFDPSEFPTFSDEQREDADGDPGSGGINRGRGDAELTWGKESESHDRFKAVALPPGHARNPDDWAPITVLPGSPNTSAELSTTSRAFNYAAGPGQAAWRRSLAPRHHSAVKKYFETSPSK